MDFGIKEGKNADTKKKANIKRVKMFTHQIPNVELKMSKNSILLEALQVFKKVFYDVKAEKIYDRYGLISYKMGECYLVAKKSSFGDIVSVSKKIWDMAKERGRMIYLYLQASGYFYRFNPQEKMDVVINERGGVKMCNFDIKYGKNLLKIKAMQHRIRQRVEKNQQYFKNLTREERDREIMMRACS